MFDSRFPNRQDWERRNEWFWAEYYDSAGQGNHFTGEQAAALLWDLQITFCGGAWAATVILSLAVVEAYLREVEAPGFKGVCRELIDAAGGSSELHWLRKRRNDLVHVTADSPAISMDAVTLDEPIWEEDARRAVKLVFEAICMSPGS